MKRLLFAGLSLLIFSLVAVSVAGAADTGRETVAIVTEPTALVDVYLDDVLLGTYPGYSDLEPLDVTFQSVPGATAYQMVMYECDFTPCPYARVLQSGFHWASNPNGTTYRFGGYVSDVCHACYYWIYAWPMTVTQVYDAKTDTYEYNYALYKGPGTFAQFSKDFVFHR